MTRVIRSVSSAKVGRNRLTLQSICRPDGIRALRPVWEQEEADGTWHVMQTSGGVPLPPEFTPRYWVDVVSKAAASGLLGSQAYKDLVVNLARGLDSSKTPSPQAFLRVTGSMQIRFDDALLDRETTRIDEVKVYRALERFNREVSASQSRDDRGYLLDYRVVEELHYEKVLKRLGDEMSALATEASLDELLALRPSDCFHGIFGDPALLDAGFDDPELFSVEFALTVV